jgi:hypothetical protein
MKLPSRRRTPRTLFGKLVRAWPTIRLAIRLTRLIYRVRRTAQVMLFTLAAVAVARILSRRRRRDRGTEPVSTYAPPPVASTAPRPVQPVNSEAPTQTERTLHAEK